MSKLSITPEIEDYAASLRSEKERLIAEKEKIDGELAAVDQQILTMEKFTGNFTKWRESHSTEAKGLHGHINVRDIAKCRTQQEALEKIAELSDGVANASEAGRLIYETKLTKGKVGSVISGVHRIMSDKERWEWISPGTFRLLTPLSVTRGNPQPEVSPEAYPGPSSEALPEPTSEAPAEPSSEAPPESTSEAPPGKVGDGDEVNSALIGQEDPEEEIVPPTESNS